MHEVFIWAKDPLQMFTNGSRLHHVLLNHAVCNGVMQRTVTLDRGVALEIRNDVCNAKGNHNSVKRP